MKEGMKRLAAALREAADVMEEEAEQMEANVPESLPELELKEWNDTTNILSAKRKDGKINL